MRKNSIAIAMTFFGVCILISAILISNALRDIAFNQHLGSSNVNVQQNQWELITVDQSHIILFNPHSGEYSTRFLIDENWTTDWQTFTLP